MKANERFGVWIPDALQVKSRCRPPAREPSYAGTCSSETMDDAAAEGSWRVEVEADPRRPRTTRYGIVTGLNSGVIRDKATMGHGCMALAARCADPHLFAVIRAWLGSSVTSD